MKEEKDGLAKKKIFQLAVSLSYHLLCLFFLRVVCQSNTLMLTVFISYPSCPLPWCILILVQFGFRLTEVRLQN